jgi:lipopolysaccharide transport system permease protein
VSRQLNSSLVYEAADNRLRRSLWGHVQYALRYWPFFLYWVRRGIITRYSQTSVGLLWAILQPVLSSLVYIVVFSFVVRVNTDPVPYPLFVLTSLVMWAYFQRIVTSSASSIQMSMDIVTKVRFPREFLPLAVVVESWIDLLFGLGIVALLFLGYGYPLTPYLLLVPVIFIVQTILGLGIGFYLAALANTVKDLFQVIPIMAQLLLYLSPVMYPLNLVPDNIRALYVVNPLATIFSAYQETILFGRFTVGPALLAVAAFSVLVLITGYLFFKRMEWRFADTL